MNPIEPILASQGVVVLDGGLATELERLGCDLGDPLWSAKVLLEQPERIARIHRCYLQAGADVIITATYQATFEGFAARGLTPSRSADLMRDGDIEEGDGVHWDALMVWLSDHDLADAANMATLRTQVDVEDLADFAILQTYFGFPVDRFSAARSRVAGGRWFWLYGADGTRIPPRIEEEAVLLDPSNDPEDLTYLLQSLAVLGYHVVKPARASMFEWGYDAIVVR